MSKQQKRKGNAQTASSARAAELLAQSGHAVPFISFSGYNSSFSNTAVAVETSQEDIDPEIRNALKKISKKDALTREKGLKQLASQIETVDVKKAHCSLPHFITVFPKLVMDGIPSIRSLSLRVLLLYINMLKKASEKCLVEILPYVFFATNDTYSQVTQSANSLLNTFPEDKLAKASLLCLTKSLELGLQIVNRSHPLLYKSEGEESDAQRLSRITVQALNFLKNLSGKICTEKDINSLLEMIHNKSLLKNILAQSAQVGGAFFALVSRLLALKWDNVATKDLLLISLSNLDNKDRLLCQFSASFFLLSSRHEVFNELSVNKAIVPKILSTVRKKEIHWENLGADRLTSILKMVILKLPVSERRDVYFRILDSFFEGLPWEASFNVDTWLCSLEIFSGYARAAGLSHGETLGLTPTDFEEILKKFMCGVEVSSDGNNIILVNKLSSLILSFLNQQSLPNEKALVVLRGFVLTLIDRLPKTESAIIDVLKAQNENLWLQISLTIIRHTQCTRELLASIIENFDEKFLCQLDSRVDLLQEIASYIDWHVEESAIRLLASLLRVYVIKCKYGDGEIGHLMFQDYYKMDTELANLRLVKAALYMVDHSIPLDNLCLKFWNQAIKSSLYLTLSNNDLFLRVFDLALDFCESDSVILQFLEENKFESSELLLHIAKKVEGKASPSVCSKVANLMLNFLIFVGTEDDVMRNLINQVLKLNTDATFITDYIRCQLRENTHITDLRPLVYIVRNLDSASTSSLFLKDQELDELLLPFDLLFGTELLIKKELFGGNWGRCFSNNDNSLVSSEDTLHRSLNEAFFLLECLTPINFDTNELSKFAASLYYIVVVSSLPLLNESSNNTRLYNELRDKVTKVILYDEKLRLFLLEYSHNIITAEPSICFLSALRTLSSGLDSSHFVQTLRTDFEHARKFSCACAAAVCMPLGVDDNVWNGTSITDWICRAEIISASCDSKLSLNFLNQFLNEGRSKFEEVLFVFQEGDKGQEINALSCALLRLLSVCSVSVFNMNSGARDFMCCALITALESYKEMSFKKAGSLFDVFFSLAVILFEKCTTVCRAKGDCSSASFFEEWSSFFSSTAEELLFSAFMSFSDIPTTSVLSYYISSAIHFCSLKTLRKTQLAPRCDIEFDAINYPVELQSLAVPLISLSTSSSSFIQFAALRVLKLVVKEMLIFENKVEAETEDAEDVVKALTRKLPVLCSRLIEANGNSAVSPAFLVWDALVTSLAEFEPIERVPYCHMLRPFLDDILLSLFEKLPVNPDVGEISMDSSLFLKEALPAEMISQYCFGLFYRTLITVPALVRQWYAALPRTVAAFINAYTTKYLSQLVWKAECEKISSQSFPAEMKVHVRGGGSVRQIVAEFEVDGSKMELNVELLPNYPLSVPVIENGKIIVARDTKKKWILQLSLFITHQNGGIADGISLWGRNIEKYMEGAEDCAICMCTVHSSTYQLPRVKCKQCKKKFHADCIRKWLESSSQLTCPLCRTIFRL